MPLSYDWVSLTPDASQADLDPAQAKMESRKAADALGLIKRPGITALRRLLPVDGALLVASGPHRWVGIPTTLTRGNPNMVRNVADSIAKTAGAVARPCGQPDVLNDVPYWAHAYLPKDVRLAAGDKDRASTQMLDRLDVDDGQVAVYSVRRVRKHERRWMKDWLGDQIPSQHDRDAHMFSQSGLGAVRVSYGARDRDTAGDGAINAASALDLGFSGFGSNPSHPCLAFAAISTIIGVILAVLGLVLAILLGWKWAWAFTGVGAALLVAGWVRWLLRPPAWAMRPRHRLTTTEHTRKAASGDIATAYNDGDNDRRDATVKIWNWQPSTIPFALMDYAIVLAPPKTGQAQTTGLSELPPALEGTSGPLLGLDADNKQVRMDGKAVWQGIMLFGEPGGGKSNSLHGILGWQAKHMGDGDALVDFESKGADSIPILTRLMPGIYVSELSDPATALPEILPTEGTPEEKATRFASLMQSALGDTAFAARSRLQTQQALTIILTAMPDPGFQKACVAHGVTSIPTDWVEGAGMLLCSKGAGEAHALGEACVQTEPSLRPTVDALQGGMGPNGRPRIPDSQLISTLSAPQNKLSMLDVPQLKSRQHIPWHTVLQGGHMLAINLGTSASGLPQLPGATRDLMAQLMFQGLRTAVEADCTGWQEKGRKAVIAIDELTDVTGNGADRATGNEQALAWLRDKGRAFGVQLAVGTQNPAQISPRLQASVLGFGTVGTFMLRDTQTAQVLADRLSVDTNMVRNLPSHVMAVGTVGTDGSAVPTLSVHAPWFDDPNLGLATL